MDIISAELGAAVAVPDSHVPVPAPAVAAVNIAPLPLASGEAAKNLPPAAQRILAKPVKYLSVADMNAIRAIYGLDALKVAA